MWKYSQEIYDQYSHLPETKLLKPAFVVPHSDLLNLDVKPDAVYAKTTFLENDIILEVRGKYTTLEKMKPYMQTFNFQSLGMLWLDRMQGILLMPNSFAQKFLATQGTPGNCLLELHFNSKILIRATDIIAKGEKIVIKKEW